MRAAQGLQSHIDDCGRQWVEARAKWDETRAAMSDLQDDFEKKHEENIKRFADFQKKIFLIALVIVAGLAVKGTPLDIVAKVLAGI